MRFAGKAAIAGFLLIIAIKANAASQPILFSDDVQGDNIGRYMAIFQDPSEKLSFEQVQNSASLFKPNKKDILNLGSNSDNNWIRFSIVNNSSHDKLVLNLANPIIDRVSFYIVKGGRVDSITVEENDPVHQRSYKHQFYIFDIPLKKGESAECYLMLRSNEQILVPLTLYTPTSIIPSLVRSDTLSGLYLGIMLVMLLYNLFIYFSARDKHYLDYVHYIFWVTITQASVLGYGHKFLWTDSVWLTANMVTFTGAMSGIATVIFAKSFLRTSLYAPKFNTALNFIIMGDILAIIVLLTGFPLVSYQIVNATAALGSPIVVYTAYVVYRKDYKPARYFLYAWSVFLASVLVFVLKDYGIISYNLFTIHSVQIGSALEAILLSFALADKINILKEEKEASQAAALEVAQENERIIREQNSMLERKVNERTFELKEANSVLNITLDDLKQAQSQLVESEKMASLGQLTAGIAHEINNPINFVTSNVMPLKRDIEMLLDAIETVEKVGLSDDTVSDKIQQIENYKEEMDFDYLKIEISHLLKGIHEGASRTAEIVKGLRIFSRVDEDDLKRADVNEGLESTMVILNNLMNNKVKVIREYGELPRIECYPGKLNQVFLNIISNAIHAMHKKFGEAPEGLLTISTSCDEEHVFIRIKDNGTGMNENTRKKIFEPFFTTKDVGEGTGLGMSIAFNTIKRHEGHIHINTKEGEGTEFILELPQIHKIKSNLVN